jgi:inorganic triphosphatase YgiF
VEVEIKLNVKPAIDGGPAMLFTRLAMLNTLGNLSLGPVSKVEIRDLYYDTPSGSLAKSGSGLRMREENGSPKVTLKKGVFVDGALTRREEFEEPLIQERFHWVLSNLSEQIGEGPFPAEDFRIGRPCGTLVPVLRVDTARIMRQIGAAAALCLDMVEYPGLTTNPYYDIEVEAIGGQAGEAFIRRVETELYTLTGGDLAPARMSKLERGLKLKERTRA